MWIWQGTSLVILRVLLEEATVIRAFLLTGSEAPMGNLQDTV